MIWCLRRRCQHLSSKWGTLSFMNCLRCLQCMGWKGGAGCGSPTGAIWRCVAGKVLGPSCGMWTQPTVHCCDSPSDWCSCVRVQVWNVRQRGCGREGEHVHRIENLATLRVYLRTHIRPSFEAAHNKLKLFLHTLVRGLKSFRTGRGPIEGKPRKEDARNEAPCASHLAWSDPCWVDKEDARHRCRNKEPHSETKCAKETWESVLVTQGMVSGWRDLISNATVTITERYPKGSTKKTC